MAYLDLTRLESERRAACVLIWRPDRGRLRLPTHSGGRRIQFLAAVGPRARLLAGYWLAPSLSPLPRGPPTKVPYLFQVSSEFLE